MRIVRDAAHCPAPRQHAPPDACPRAAPLNRRSLRSAERSPAELAMRRAIRARDAGLRRIAAITRGIVAAVVALSGALAVLAASGFHGHTVSAGTSRAASAQPGARGGATLPRLRSGSRTHGGSLAHAARATAAPHRGSQAAPTTQTQTTPAPTTPAPTTPAQTTPVQTTPAPSATTTTAPATSSASASSSSTLAQPSQAPAQTPATPVVVSGGS